MTHTIEELEKENRMLNMKIAAMQMAGGGMLERFAEECVSMQCQYEYQDHVIDDLVKALEDVVPDEVTRKRISDIVTKARKDMS